MGVRLPYFQLLRGVPCSAWYLVITGVFLWAVLFYFVCYSVFFVCCRVFRLGVLLSSYLCLDASAGDSGVFFRDLLVWLGEYSEAC